MAQKEEDEGPEAGSLSAGGRPTAQAQALHPDEIHAGEGRSRKRTKAGERRDVAYFVEVCAGPWAPAAL